MLVLLIVDVHRTPQSLPKNVMEYDVNIHIVTSMAIFTLWLSILFWVNVNSIIHNVKIYIKLSNISNDLFVLNCHVLLFCNTLLV